MMMMDSSSQSGMLSPNHSSTSFNNPSLSSIVSDANSSVYGRDSSTWQLNKGNASSFVKKFGRSYCNNDSLPYPLPCDPEEVNHRQNLVHLLYKELFGGYFTAEFPTAADIPKRVLDIGCGNGQWIASVADEFASRGRPDVEFVGLDVVQVHSDMTGINFTFKQYDILQEGALPFETDEFDYIMSRDLSLVVPSSVQYDQKFEDVLRILRPGGVVEIQCTDHTIRSLQKPSVVPDLATGAYPNTPSTPFVAKPENSYAQKWNQYVNEMLNKRMFPPVPCAIMQPMLVMETAQLAKIHQRRLALPLDDPTWEEDLLKSNLSESTSAKPSPYNSGSKTDIDDEGGEEKEEEEGGVDEDDDDDDDLSFVTAEGSISGNGFNTPPPSASYSSRPSPDSRRTTLHDDASSNTSNPFALKLTEDAKGVRYLARELFVAFINSLEPVLREVNGVPQDEWDRWYRDLSKNFFEEGGLKGGECLELGAWYAVKHPSKGK